MGDVFKAISGGLARFVFAWMLPTLIAGGLFWVFVLPGISHDWLMRPVTSVGTGSAITAGILFSFCVLAVSSIFAYAAMPIYQVLEGYRFPKWLQRARRRHHLREFERLRCIERRFRVTNQLPPGITTDDLVKRYPRDAASVRSTLLGNALTSMEHWSSTRYQLDSQTMWHELLAVSSDNVRRDVDEGRAPVDFYVSAVANMTVLAVTALVVGVVTPQHQAIVIGVLAAFTVPYSYRSAVRNTVDWAQSVKAMVNVGRHDLARAMGLQIPQGLKNERDMWSAHMHVVELANDAYIESYNSFRVRPADEQSSEPAQPVGLLRRIFSLRREPLDVQ